MALPGLTSGGSVGEVVLGCLSTTWAFGGERRCNLELFAGCGRRRGKAVLGGGAGGAGTSRLGWVSEPGKPGKPGQGAPQAVWWGVGTGGAGVDPRWHHRERHGRT